MSKLSVKFIEYVLPTDEFFFRVDDPEKFDDEGLPLGPYRCKMTGPGIAYARAKQRDEGPLDAVTELILKLVDDVEDPAEAVGRELSVEC